MSELDKTIEELEAEVMAELEEADASKDPQKKSATAAQKGDKVDDKVSGAVQDTGAPVVKPDQKDAPAKKVAASAKEIQGDAQQKSAKEEPKVEKPKTTTKRKAPAKKKSTSTTRKRRTTKTKTDT